MLVVEVRQYGLLRLGQVVVAVAVDAVDRFRSDQGWRTTVPGFVDGETVATLWAKLEEAGKADAMRERLLEIQRIRR